MQSGVTFQHLPIDKRVTPRYTIYMVAWNEEPKEAPVTKKWYAIKRKTEKRWKAYKIPASHLKHLKDGYEWRGPFDSLINAMIGVNKKVE